MEFEKKLLESAIMWGPGLVLAVLMIWCAFKLVKEAIFQGVNLGGKFLESNHKQTTAIEDLTSSIKNSVTRDNSEHREMIVLLKVLCEKIEKCEGCKYGGS